MRALIVVALAVVAADDHYGFTQEQLNSSAAASIEFEHLAFPALTAELKATAPAARAQVVTALGTMVRAYVESPAFKAHYAQYIESQRPPKPTPKRPFNELFAEKKKEIEAQRASLQSQLASLSPDQRKQVTDAFETGVKQQLEIYKDQKMMTMMEEQRFNHEKQSYDEALQHYPDDYRVRLRARLQAFFDETAGVDYSAKTVGTGGGQRFADDAYETKPDLWKRAYRAGKPATDAARKFAKDWLAALGT